jgi:hypothetical protein
METQTAHKESNVGQQVRSVASLQEELRLLRQDVYRMEDLLRARMDAMFDRLNAKFDPALAGVDLQARRPPNPYV